MQLTNILNDIDYKIIQGDINIPIDSITFDSRTATENSLFICIVGFTHDGHEKIQQAIENGAKAIVIQHEKNISDVEYTTIIKVQDTRDSMAKLAVNFYEKPAESLNLIGITGTNGKTSITHLLQEILHVAEYKTGTIGTIGTMIDNELIETNNTTPESLHLQEFYKEMVDKQTDYCLIEVSSHALQLKRAAHTKFNTGIFTNLTPDHLELHKTMEDYFLAKAMLFDLTEKFNIINADDLYGQKLIEYTKNSRAKTYTYGIHEKADFYATNIQYKFNETTFILHTPFEKAEIKIHQPGEIYVSNSLAAIAAAYLNGIDLEIIKQGLSQAEKIPGRFEVAYKKDDFKVIIDFAHTEDALQKTLSTLRPFVDGKLIVVFGVYADMSESGKEKRYGMGRVAAEYADFSIVTLDNPKYYDIKQITKETTEAIERNNGKYIAIEDREEAIRYAIEISEKNDAILLAGKGHERTQVIAGEEISFSELEIVQSAMETKRF